MLAPSYREDTFSVTTEYLLLALVRSGRTFSGARVFLRSQSIMIGESSSSEAVISLVAY